MLLKLVKIKIRKFIWELRIKKLDKLDEEIENIEKIIEEIIKNSKNKEGEISEELFIEYFAEKYTKDLEVSLWLTRLVVFQPFMINQKGINEQVFREWLIKVFKLKELEEKLDKLEEKYEKKAG